jgi:hypothetical protein
VPLTHGFFRSIEPQDQLKVTITKGKALNCKALPCLWTTVEKNAKEHQAALMKEWLSNIGWKTTPGQIQNKQRDGCIEGRSACLIAANRETVNRLPEHFADSNDGCCCLEQILDVGDGTSKDCFTFFATCNADSKPTSNADSKPSSMGASIESTLTAHHGNQKKDISFRCYESQPSIGEPAALFCAFAVEVTCGITAQKARPARNHELLKACGFEEEQTT